MTWKIKKWGPKSTRAEWRLRRALEKEGIPFTTQKILQGRERQHRVDFYLAPKLVIEVDGSSHRGEQLLKDELATADLENAELPFTVVRFRDEEINKNLLGVLVAIKKLYEVSVPK